MRYSILQTHLDIPPVETLRRAFRSIKCLTDYDAHSMAADAFGILVKNLSAADATALQGALRVEGIETEIIEDSRIPALPPAKMVQRLDCLDGGMQVYDPLGRSFSVDWNHLMLVAAGEVTLTDFKRVEKRFPVTRYTADGFGYTTMESEHRVREERNAHLIMEVVLSQSVMRYSINAATFNFAYLGDRKRRESAMNFHQMVRDICRLSPKAALNRGAYYIREGAVASISYPTKNAFYEEISWLIWRWQQAQRNAP